MDNFQLALQAAADGMKSALWTAFPGIVQSYDAAKQTVVVQPAIQAQVQNEKGKWSNVTITVLPDVPVMFPGGGGFALTFPLAQGDEGIVVIAKNCIDAWWQNGGVQPQAEVRSHNLSDAMFIPRLRSVPHVPAGQSTNSVQLRKDDGTLYVELAAGGVVNIVAPGGAHITGNVLVTGNIVATGDITWPHGSLSGGGAAIDGNMTATGNIIGNNDVIAGIGGADQVGLRTHRHGGVLAGGGQTTAPVAGT